MNWRHVLYAALAAIVPFGYSWITGQFPEFPMAADVFSSLILWVVGLAVGGWQFAKYYLINTKKLTVPVAAGVNAYVDVHDIMPLLKAMLSVLLPFLYNAIIGLNNTFPLAETDFINVLLWILGLLVGGVQIAKSVWIAQFRLEK